MSAPEIAPTAALLAEVFPGGRVARSDYLDWLYRRSPFGEVIEANLDGEHGRAGHYALVPIALARDGVDVPAALSLNTAVAERARGGGLFVRLAEDAMGQARDRGVAAIVGVANANSTHGFVHRLQFELLTPLPASVMVWTPGSRRAIRSAWHDERAFAAGGLAADVGALLSVPEAGEGRRWTEDTLRWRLSCPGTRYALHRGERLLAVSCVEQRRGVRVAVLLKVFSDAPVPAATARALVRAACAFHRAPLALHVGLNDLVRFVGMTLPRRLREAPLNLIYRALDGDLAPARITRFEFLDFDAY